MSNRKRVCVFCGARHGKRPEYERAASQFVHLLVADNWGLVYGGGNVGMMGVIAQAMIDAGGEVIGVIPKSLVDHELAHLGVTTLHVVDTMHERKALMADLADSFVALPGAYGTMDEFCEILTWSQLGIHSKPCGLLNTCGYYDKFLEFLDHCVAEEFLTAPLRSAFVVDHEPEGLFNKLKGFTPQVFSPMRTDEIR